jgi:hypothetical protein
MVDTLNKNLKENNIKNNEIIINNDEFSLISNNEENEDNEDNKKN